MEKTINVSGMHCKSCEFLITDSLKDIGVESTADHKKQMIRVKFDPAKVGLDKIRQVIKDSGYKVESIS